MVWRPWTNYAAAAAAAVGVFFVLPQDGWLATIWQVGVGWASAAAIVVGVRLHRPPAGSAWYLFATGIFLNAGGILVEAVLTARGWVLEPPSPPDFFYLALYPALIAGLTMIVLRRTTKREWSTLLDAMMISTGLGLLMWVAVIRPALGQPAYSPLSEVVIIAYPIGDLVVLALVVRLIVGAGARGAAYRMLAGSISLFLVGDVTWAVVNQLGLSPGPHVSAALSMVFLAAYAVMGVTALHPSMRTITRPAVAGRSGLGLVMIAVLATVALIAPTLLMVEAARNHVRDGIAIAIGSMALFLLVIVRMTMLFRQVQSQAEALQRLSEVDELTNLPNRRALTAALGRAVDRAGRDGSPLSLALLDLDHFKRFNDRYGHPTGDRLLRDASAAWLAQLRSIDIISRYGGEEFVLVLPATDLDEAAEITARLQAATPLEQTFSAGLARWDGAETPEELISRADTALYEAKGAGRNRTVTANPSEPSPTRARAARTGGAPHLPGHQRGDSRVDEPA